MKMKHTHDQLINISISKRNQKQIEEIREEYFRCYRKVMEFKTKKRATFNVTLVSSDINGTIEKYLRYIKQIEDCFNLLDSVSRMIINNEYFYNDFSGWWKSIYSKTTFYRLRNDAIKNFLSNYERRFANNL